MGINRIRDLPTPSPRGAILLSLEKTATRGHRLTSLLLQALCCTHSFFLGLSDHFLIVDVLNNLLKQNILKKKVKKDK